MRTGILGTKTSQEALGWGDPRAVKVIKDAQSSQLSRSFSSLGLSRRTRIECMDGYHSNW